MFIYKIESKVMGMNWIVKLFSYSGFPYWGKDTLEMFFPLESILDLFSLHYQICVLFY